MNTNDVSNLDKSKVLKYINLAFMIIILLMLLQIAAHIAIEYYLKSVLVFDDSIKSYLLIMVVQTLVYMLCKYIVSNSSKTTN